MTNLNYMKCILLLIGLLFTTAIFSQAPKYTIHPLSLPPELSWYDNQFSGLYVQDGKLFLMSESRLQDNAEGKLYAIALADLDKKMKDTAYTLPYQKYLLHNLEKLRARIDTVGDKYEGLEAIEMKGNTVYLSVETATPSNNCYLLKGTLKDTAIYMDTIYLVKMPKPVTASGAHIYNAGFEAITKIGNVMYSFFEYNYFPTANYVYAYSVNTTANKGKPQRIPINKLPFRITDITATSPNRFTAINYFFEGEGKDTVYRTPANDVANTPLIKDASGYHSYVRLIDIQFNSKSFTWKPLLDLPTQYMGYNWEGIAAYKGGYFLINDKYTPAKPYASTLLFLELEGKR